MTAARSLRLVPAAEGSQAQRYGNLVDEKFLVEAGWDADRQVLAIPWHHPRLGWRVCAVDSCDGPAFGTSAYCSSCLAAWKASMPK